MASRFVDTEFFRSPWIRSLPAAYRQLWLYIWLDCNAAGFWKPEIDVAAARLGCELTEQGALDHFKGHVTMHPSGEWELVGFLKYQFPRGLRLTNPLHRSIFRILKEYFPLLPFEGGEAEFAGRILVIGGTVKAHPQIATGPSKGLRRAIEGPQETETETETETVPPPIDLVQTPVLPGAIEDGLIVAQLKQQFLQARVPCSDVPPFTVTTIMSAGEQYSYDAVNVAAKAYLAQNKGRPRTLRDFANHLDELLQQTGANKRPTCAHAWKQFTQPDENWPTTRRVRWRRCKKCKVMQPADGTIEKSTFTLEHRCEVDVELDEKARDAGFLQGHWCRHCGKEVPSLQEATL